MRLSEKNELTKCQIMEPEKKRGNGGERIPQVFSQVQANPVQAAFCAFSKSNAFQRHPAPSALSHSPITMIKLLHYAVPGIQLNALF